MWQLQAKSRLCKTELEVLEKLTIKQLTDRLSTTFLYAAYCPLA